MGSRVSWATLRSSEAYQGKWVALDGCRYDKVTAKPIDGELVDADEDLAALCARLRESARTHCAIVLCEREPTASRRASVPPPSMRGSVSH